jgi:hypothetical protein
VGPAEHLVVPTFRWASATNRPALRPTC